MEDQQEGLGIAANGARSLAVAPNGSRSLNKGEHHRIVIVGSGFAGLGVAIKLKQAGIEDFVVLERDSEVGGTWWANTYPGCQCDIPSHLYSFSFAPNPRLVADLLAAARDPARTCATCAPSTTSTRTSASTTRSPRPPGTRMPACGGSR